MPTIKISLSVDGKEKIRWITLGDGKDFTTAKFAIDEVFDKIEERHTPKKN